MDSTSSSPPPPDPVYLPAGSFDRVKILIAGPFGIGKTTAIETVSEIRSLHTEEVMTQPAAEVDDLHVAGKTTTTVATDFGRITLESGVVLYLFGTPGQDRFRPLWKDHALGALGALVLVDTRRLDDSFEVIDLVEDYGLDYAVAVNLFPESPEYALDIVRGKLDIEDHIPLVTVNALDRRSTLDALKTLTAYLVTCAGDIPS
ncbi:ATP/GTP-binding protein [Streptomyces sp. NPDC004237]|uniref:GTP-binding protein n=1 Tax=Streptomyces sp. NPDC004237 TaxID=3154455 RepID=UPI0033A28C55